MERVEIDREEHAERNEEELGALVNSEPNDDERNECQMRCESWGQQTSFLTRSAASGPSSDGTNGRDCGRTGGGGGPRVRPKRKSLVLRPSHSSSRGYVCTAVGVRFHSDRANADIAKVISNNPPAIIHSTDPLCWSGSHPDIASIQSGQKGVITHKSAVMEAALSSIQNRARKLLVTCDLPVYHTAGQATVCNASSRSRWTLSCVRASEAWGNAEIRGSSCAEAPNAVAAA